MTTLNKVFNKLPPQAQQEVLDFLEFLAEKYAKSTSNSHASEQTFWLHLQEESVKKIWDNKEDDIYNELLKR